MPSAEKIHVSRLSKFPAGLLGYHGCCTACGGKGYGSKGVISGDRMTVSETHTPQQDEVLRGLSIDDLAVSYEFQVYALQQKYLRSAPNARSGPVYATSRRGNEFRENRSWRGWLLLKDWGCAMAVRKVVSQFF